MLQKEYISSFSNGSATSLFTIIEDIGIVILLVRLVIKIWTLLLLRRPRFCEKSEQPTPNKNSQYTVNPVKPKFFLCTPSYIQFGKLPRLSEDLANPKKKDGRLRFNGVDCVLFSDSGRSKLWTLFKCFFEQVLCCCKLLTWIFISKF